MRLVAAMVMSHLVLVRALHGLPTRGSVLNVLDKPRYLMLSALRATKGGLGGGDSAPEPLRGKGG